MRILAISYAYPPLAFPRAIQVARLLAHLPDADVTVVCGAEPGDGDQSLLAAYPDAGRRVERVPWSRAAALRLRLRDRLLEERLLVPDRYRGWLPAARRAIHRLGRASDFDVLVTFGQPMSDHLLGLRLARRRRIRWVAHFSDPWVDSAFRNHRRVTHSLNGRLEAQVVRCADALVFTSAETADLMLAKYPPRLREKAAVVPHAYDDRLYPAAAPLGGPLRVRYVGNLYGHRGPEPLGAALAILAARDPTSLEDVRIELVGSRQYEPDPELFARLPAGLVTFKAPVPYLDSLSLIRGSDLLLVLDAPGERSVFLPSKLVEYVGARRPIFALTPEGAAASLVRQLGGRCADPGDPDGAATELAAALADAKGTRDASWGSAGTTNVFSAPVVAACFRKVLEGAQAR